MSALFRKMKRFFEMTKDRIQRFDNAMAVMPYALLLLPVAIFFLTWTRLYVGIPATLFSLAGLYFALKRKRKSLDIFGEKRGKRLAAIALCALLWTVLSGQGGLMFQNIDYHMRNAIFSDLVKYDWPVIFHIPEDAAEGLAPGSAVRENAEFFAGKDVTIVYYLAYWLPPALVGKAFYRLLGEGAGMILANAALIIWTFCCTFTVLYLFCRAFKKFSYKSLLVFIFFSGLDILGAVFFFAAGLQGLLMTEGRIIPHLDTWTMQQYSSNTTALFWVFNQALPVWLFCCILLGEEDLKPIFLPYSCLALSSTLPMIGALPIIFYFIFKRVAEEIRANGQDLNFKNVFSHLLKYVNLSNVAGAAILVLSYLYLMSSPRSDTFSFMSGSPNLIQLGLIMMSLLFEVMVILFVLYQAEIGEKKGLLYTVTALLFVVPFFNVGEKFDFTMRASLPPLFFLCFLCCHTLLKEGKKHIKRALAIVLIIGSLTAAAEILQPIAYVFTGKSPVAAGIESLAEVGSSKFDPKNCLGTLDSFFMKYILKR